MTAMKAFFRWKPVESGCGDGGAVEQAIEPERAQPSLIRYPSVDRARPVNLRVGLLSILTRMEVTVMKVLRITTCSIVLVLLFNLPGTRMDVFAQSTQSGPPSSADDSSSTCPLTEPIWGKPPHPDGAGPLHEGYWYVNDDRSIWAPKQVWHAGNGNKLIWIRPQGTQLKVTARRLDGPAPPFEIHIPCCYPTGFQMTGAMFPVAGCWEMSAKAGRSKMVVVLEVTAAEDQASGQRPAP